MNHQRLLLITTVDKLNYPFWPLPALLLMFLQRPCHQFVQPCQHGSRIVDQTSSDQCVVVDLKKAMRKNIVLSHSSKSICLWSCKYEVWHANRQTCTLSNDGIPSRKKINDVLNWRRKNDVPIFLDIMDLSQQQWWLNIVCKDYSRGRKPGKRRVYQETHGGRDYGIEEDKKIVFSCENNQCLYNCNWAFLRMSQVGHT